MITRGQKTMMVVAVTDTHVIGLERSERGGHYQLTTGSAEPAVFAKLNGGVPQQITEALRIAPVTDSGSVNFAGQFDRPYLLDESGSAVARQLGELTNVNQIFEAVRAAVRIRNSNAAILKNRRADLDLLRSRLADFAGLPGKLVLLERADALDQQRRNLTQRLEKLQAAIDQVEHASDVLTNTKVPPAPDAAAFNRLVNRFNDLNDKIQAVESKKRRLQLIDDEVKASAHTLAHLEFKFRTSLIQAKVCPTCGQATQE